MKKVAQTLFIILILLQWHQGIAQDKTPNANYTYKKEIPTVLENGIWAGKLPM